MWNLAFGFFRHIRNLIKLLKNITLHLDVDIRHGIDGVRELVKSTVEVAESLEKDTPWAIDEHVVAKIEDISSQLKIHDNYGKDFQLAVDILVNVEKSVVLYESMFEFLEHADLLCYLIGSRTTTFPNLHPLLNSDTDNCAPTLFRFVACVKERVLRLTCETESESDSDSDSESSDESDSGNEMDNEVHDEVDGDVYDEVDGDVHDEVDGDVHDVLDGEVPDEVDNEVHREVDVDENYETAPMDGSGVRKRRRTDAVDVEAEEIEAKRVELEQSQEQHDIDEVRKASMQRREYRLNFTIDRFYALADDYPKGTYQEFIRDQDPEYIFKVRFYPNGDEIYSGLMINLIVNRKVPLAAGENSHAYLETHKITV
ncbi:hypothetical protein L5515_018219 [Caenorhabditis briggsae]|uniref:Uncharacterized protein n=1 Tax=Caenorhabditis briggsae TaxID=6238 RepID=A0AAE9FHG4_CAEBR|nr:hypothetical protein L5515_018219 [Caenorhabditis briggsae]